MTEKHVRVYYSVIDDPRFASVYHDARNFGTWTQLLLVADAMWPAAAPVPAYVNKAALKGLVEAGLVEVFPHQHFRIHGLDAERANRSEQGRLGGLASARSRAVERPLNDRSTEGQLAEQSKAEQSKAEQGDPLDTYWTLSGSFPSGNAKKWLEEMSNEFGPEATSNALASEWSHGSRNDFLKRAQNRLRADVVKVARALEVKVTEKEQARRAAMDITPEEAERRAAEAKRLMGEWMTAMPAPVGPFQPIGSKP